MSTEQAFMSELAKERGANFFVWGPYHPTPILSACANLDIVGSLDVAVLLKWLRMIPTPSKVTIKPIELQFIKPFVFRIVNPGKPVDVSQALSPGIYGSFYEEGTPSAESAKRFRPDPETVEFTPRSLRDNYMTLTLSPNEDNVQEILDSYNVPNPLNMEAMEENGSKCIFTGTRDVQLHWIFPPAMVHCTPAYVWAWTAETQIVDRNIESFTVVANLLPMRTDLYELWHNNEFGVDIYDNYRVRRFTKAAHEIEDLPEYISAPKNKATETFLREHFRWTLKVRFAGGDIARDKPDEPNDKLNEVDIYDYF